MKSDFWAMPIFNNRKQEKNFNKMHKIFKKIKREAER